jgi:hypothetical protein
VRFGAPDAGFRVEPVDRGALGAAVAGSTTASGASEEAAAEERRFAEGVDADFAEEDDVLRGDFGVRGDVDVDRPDVEPDVDRAGVFISGAAALPSGASAGVCSDGVDGVCSSSFRVGSEVTS